MPTTAMVHDDHQLFPLLTVAPAVVEKLTMRPRLSDRALLRWALEGSHGEKLKTVTAGRTRLTCTAWLLDFFERVEQARMAKRKGKAKAIMTKRRRTRR